MGLDMYLWRKTYIGASWERREITGTIEIRQQGKKIPLQASRLHEITEEVMYWRKANAIHNWFVQNVQDGLDDCKEWFVPVEKLVALCRTLRRVMYKHELAPKILPTATGCFFGSLDYGDYYFEAVEETYKELRKLIIEYKKLPTEWRGDVGFYYESSW